ncbi:MAG: hypothetical protein ABI894_10735 [Ilumatobacteraceae bacterium]
MTKLWRVLAVGIALMAVMALGAIAAPAPRIAATAATVPATTVDAPPVTNDLIPTNNDATNCIGTVEQANCGSKARADGHTYLVFAFLAAGMGFIAWRIARGVRARDAAHQPTPRPPRSTMPE